MYLSTCAWTPSWVFSAPLHFFQMFSKWDELNCMWYTKDRQSVSPTFLFICSSPPLIALKILPAKILSQHYTKNAHSVAGSVEAQEPFQGWGDSASTDCSPGTDLCQVHFASHQDPLQIAVPSHFVSRAIMLNFRWLMETQNGVGLVPTNTCKPH